MPLTITSSEDGYQLTTTNMRGFRKARSLFGNFYTEPEGIYAGQEGVRAFNRPVIDEINKRFERLLGGIDDALGLTVGTVESPTEYQVCVQFRKCPIASTGGTNADYLDSKSYQIKDETNGPNGWTLKDGPTPEDMKQTVEAIWMDHTKYPGGWTEHRERAKTRKLNKAYRDGKIQVKGASRFVDPPVGESMKDPHHFGYQLTATMSVGDENLSYQGIKITPEAVEFRKDTGWGEPLGLLLIPQDAADRNADLVTSRFETHLVIDGQDPLEVLKFMKDIYDAAGTEQLLEMLEIRKDMKGGKTTVTTQRILQKEYDGRLDDLIKAV